MSRPLVFKIKSTSLSRASSVTPSQISPYPNNGGFFSGKGGLGLTPISEMIQSLQVHILCKVILVARRRSFLGFTGYLPL